MRQSHHLAVALVGIQYARAHTTDVFGEAHDEFLADGVDGRVGNLCELLAEIVEEYLRFVREHGERSVVSHRCRGLLAFGGHRHEGQLDVFLPEAELRFLGFQVGNGIVYLASAVYFFKLDAVGVEPLAIGMSVCQLLLDLAIVIDFALLGVDEQNLSGLQSTLLGHLRGVEVDDTHL